MFISVDEALASEKKPNQDNFYSTQSHSQFISFSSVLICFIFDDEG